VQRARHPRAAIATPSWRGALLIRDRNKRVSVVPVLQRIISLRSMLRRARDT
jgi:hypothetical protein